MSAPYSLIAIIYNPNSTGSGEALAKDFASKIADTFPQQAIKLIESEHTGHGIQLARELAEHNDTPLIISSSGDGGYHDVVNGIMEASRTGHTAVAGLLPGGNANDHYENLHSGEPLTAISHNDEQTIDLLQIETTVKGKPCIQYAHSYIGIGFTPVVGRELNKTKLNRFNEIVIVLKELISYKSVKIVVGGKPHTYTSLVFSNVAKMSKVFKLANTARVDDGKFEINAPERRTKLSLITTFLKASTLGQPGSTKSAEFKFKTIKPLLVQLDGETVTIDPNTVATVTLARSALRCII